MKFLRNTATDFFAHRARFVFFDQVDDYCECDKTESSTETNIKQETEQVVQEQRSELTKHAKDCTPKGIWSTKVQNERAGTIESKHEQIHLVEYGDTLGSIVKGMTGKLDYSRPVLYRSKKLTPARIAQWNKTNTCFPIPNNLGQTEQPFDLRVVNAIYPGQIVYIEQINGVKYIIVEDGQTVSGGGTSSSTTHESTTTTTTTTVETENETEKQERCHQTPIIDNDCGENKCEYDFSAIFNGARAEDGTSISLISELTGVEDSEKAMEAYLTLYGKKEWVGVEKDGVYTVLEKHYNPPAGVPLWNSLKEIFTNKSLADTFRKAGYTNAQELADKFTGEVNLEGKQNIIHENATKFLEKAGDKNSGATRDVIVRTVIGAGVAIGMAAALSTPISAAVVLAGLPLLKFRTGIKRFDPTASVEKIWEVFSNSDATTEQMNDCCDDVDFTENSSETSGYIDIQKSSVESSRKTAFILNSVVGENSVLKHGPGKTPPEGITMTAEEMDRYKKHAENLIVVGDEAEKMLEQLALNGYYFENGAEYEAEYARRAKKFKLTGNNKDNFDANMRVGKSTLVWKTSEENYEEALDQLVSKFNNVAAEELYGKLEKDENYISRENTINLIHLKLTDLANALENGGEFYLGRLPNKDDINRKLYVKFVPSHTGQGKGTAADGDWEMYIEDTDKNGTGSTRSIPYNEAAALISKKTKQLEPDDISRLGFNPDNLLTSGKEKRSLIDKLNFFNLMIGQMNQINEAKDQMLLSALNKQAFQEIVEIENRLDIGLRCRDTKTETQEQYQYRVAVGSKFALFVESKDDPNGFAKFKKGVMGFADIAFSPEILTQIEKVFNREHGALDRLVLSPKFQKEMSILSQNMECVNDYLSMEDLDACAEYAKDNTFISGWTAMRQSTNETVSFGDAYILYLLGQGVLNTTFTDQIPTTEWHNFSTGETIPKTPGGLPAGWEEIPTTKTIVRKIRNWATKGWLDDAGRKAVIAVSGGRITNGIIDAIVNTPEN